MDGIDGRTRRRSRVARAWSLGACVAAVSVGAPVTVVLAAESSAAAERAARAAQAAQDRAQSQTQQQEARALAKIEAANTQQRRRACKEALRKEHGRFILRQIKRREKFQQAESARRAKFYATPRTPAEREAFRVKHAKRHAHFVAMQAKRRERFEVREAAAKEHCSTLVAAPQGAAVLDPAAIYLGTIDEADELGGEEVLSEEL
jgi:ParB-like chromosome segregation protein Spo0J